LKIYTKTGDSGETSLIYGRRVGKDDLRVETYGTVDEVNAALGLAVSMLRESQKSSKDLLAILQRIQRDLFDVGRDLATPEDKQDTFFMDQERVLLLEKVIDQLDKELLPLKQFILPGGTKAAAQLHVARTVVRRAERWIVRLNQEQRVNIVLLHYLNRLSDLLFVMSRVVNARAGVSEPVVDFQSPPPTLEG
jgi:cob(I)alamin adenosyltransferase